MTSVKASRLADGYFAFCVVALMISAYLLPKHIHSAFHYLYWIAFILALRSRSVKETVRLPLVLLLAAFIGYTSLSSLWAHDGGRYALESLKDGAYLGGALIVIVAAVLAFGIDRIQSWLMTVSIVLACTVVLATLIFEQEAVRAALHGGGRLTHRALFELADNPIHSGFFVGLAAMFAVYRFRRAEGKCAAYTYFAIVLALCAFVVLTKSRGAIVFFAVSVGLMFYFIAPVSRRRDVALLVVGALVMGVVMFANPDLVLARFRGESIRLQILSEYYEMLAKAPFFGVGWSEDMGIVIPGGHAFSKPHNAFFHVLLVGGIFGALLFLAFTVHPIWFAMAQGSDGAKIVALWLIFGCMYMAVDGRFPIRSPSSQWLYYWLPIFMLIGAILRTRKLENARA